MKINISSLLPDVAVLNNTSPVLVFLEPSRDLNYDVNSGNNTLRGSGVLLGSFITFGIPYVARKTAVFGA